MEQPEGLEALILEAYTYLSKQDLPSAKEAFEAGLKVDFEDKELIFALICANWWADSIRIESTNKNDFEAAEYLVGRWKVFKNYITRLDTNTRRTIAAFKQYVFARAFNHYATLTENGECADSEILFRLGFTCKCKGDYETALNYLKLAIKEKKDDATVLAELADTYALLDETKASKVAFREAFFLNPQKVDMDLLESRVILDLRDKVEELGKTGIEVAEWIPVYGVLSKVFSIEWELKPVEVSKLKQSIYELETELASDGKRKNILVPRLINRYFWLIGHYINTKEDKSKIDELLLKVKILDPVVHKQYIA